MGQDAVFEEIPRLKRRVGDTVLAGANNAAVLLGRDRQGSVDSGYGSGPGAGAIHLIVGRRGEDPSPSSDAATVYLSAKTDPDEIAGTGTVGSTSADVSAIVLRADCVRIVPRRDIKISVGRAYLTMSEDGRVVIEGEVSLGKGASQQIIRGDAFAAFWAAHVHPTPVGPSGPPQPMPPALLSQRNKVL